MSIKNGGQNSDANKAGLGSQIFNRDGDPSKQQEDPNTRNLNPNGDSEVFLFSHKLKLIISRFQVNINELEAYRDQKVQKIQKEISKLEDELHCLKKQVENERSKINELEREQPNTKER